MKIKYDASLFPPAPVVEVVVRNPPTSVKSRPLRMQIDTGADISLIPAIVVSSERLGLVLGPKVELVGVDDRPIEFPTVETQMILDSYSFSGVYGLVDTEIGILGRDVLNQLILLLDGPEETLSLIESIERDRLIA